MYQRPSEAGARLLRVSHQSDTFIRKLSVPQRRFINQARHDLVQAWLSNPVDVVLLTDATRRMREFLEELDT